MAIDYSGLFASPADIRGQRIDNLMKERMAVKGMGGSMSGLLGQVAAGTGGMLAEATAGAFGLKTNEEVQAEQMQKIATTIDWNDPDSLAQGVEQMKKINPAAAVQMSEKVNLLRQQKFENDMAEKGYDLREKEFGLSEQRMELAIRAQNFAEQGAEMLSSEETAKLGFAPGTVVQKKGGVYQVLQEGATPQKFANARTMLDKDGNVRLVGTAGGKSVESTPEGLVPIDMKALGLKPVDLATAEIGVGESEFVKKLAGEDAKAYTASSDAVVSANNQLSAIGEMEKLLDSGTFTGITANYELGMAKIGQELGLVGQDTAETVANTEAFIAAAGQNVINILGSGALGSGTGISDKDKEFVKDIVGGNITLDEQAIRRIIRINREVAVKAVKEHNRKVDEYGSRYEGVKLDKRYYVGQNSMVNGTMYTYDGSGWKRVD